MASDVSYTFDIGVPGNKLESGTLTHQAGDFSAFVAQQMRTAEEQTATPDLPVVVEVFVNGALTTHSSNLIGVDQRRALMDIVASEHLHRAGLPGVEGAPTKQEMDDASVAQDTTTDGDQGPGNPTSE